MGRSVAEATNAWWILRTLGETGFLLLFAAALRDAAVFFRAVADFRGAFFAPD